MNNRLKYMTLRYCAVALLRALTTYNLHSATETLGVLASEIEHWPDPTVWRKRMAWPGPAGLAKE